MRSFALCYVLLALGACSSARKTTQSPNQDGGRETTASNDGDQEPRLASADGSDAEQTARGSDAKGLDAEMPADLALPHDGAVDQPPDSAVGPDDAVGLDMGVPVDAHVSDAGRGIQADAVGLDTGVPVDAGSARDGFPADLPTEAGAVDFKQLVEEITQAIAASSCPDDCPMVTITASPRPAQARSQGQRILLIDDGIAFSAATRYASRTLAYLRLGPDGSYRDYAPTFEMPAEAYAILKKVDDVWPPVRGSDFHLGQPFADKFYGKLPDKLGDTWFGHGSDIQAFLTEAIPDAQFVISEDQLNSPMPCRVLDAATEAAGWQELEARLANMQKSVVSAITQHGVNYVHLSWGLEHRAVVDSFVRDCGQEPSREVARKVLALYVSLLRALTSVTSPGATGQDQPVLLFQAGASASPAEDYLMDCADIPGRIRVMSAAYSGFAVPQGGSHDYDLLQPPERNGLACNDVFMVMGYAGIFDQPRDPYFPSLASGLGAAPRPTWPSTPSFANPLALAHFICLTLRFPDQPASWTGRLTDAWSKPILDPLLYRALPVEAGACVPASGSTSPYP